MSIDTNGFMKQGVNPFELKKYLEGKYSEVEMRNEGSENFPFSVFIFKDGEDERSLFVSLCVYDEENSYPVPVKKNVSCFLSLGCFGNSVKIMTDIIQNFGGGFILPSDSGYDGTGWEFVAPIENSKRVGFSDLEIAVFDLIKKNCKTKGLSDKDYAIFDFVVNNIDKLKEM